MSLCVRQTVAPRSSSDVSIHTQTASPVGCIEAALTPVAVGFCIAATEGTKWTLSPGLEKWPNAYPRSCLASLR